MLDGFHNKVAEETNSAVKASAQSLETGFKKHVTDLLRSYDVASSRRIAAIETSAKELADRQDAQQKDIATMHGDILRLQRSLVVAESAMPTKKVLDAEEFDRESDLTLIKVSAAEAIAKEAALDALADIIQSANLDASHFKFQGPSLSKSFVMQFTGEKGLAAKRARRFLLARRSPDGDWLPLAAINPTGSTATVYLNEDKSDKRIRTETFTRRLERAFKTAQPIQHVRAHRWTKDKHATVLLDAVPVAQLSVPSKEDQPTILWNATAVANLNVKKEDITAAFNSSSSSSSTIQWSV